MKIYTRKGDDGGTGLFGGLRVSKANPRVEAYGLVDELNAILGWARVPELPDPVEDLLSSAQEACFRLGAWLASAPGVDPGLPDFDGTEVLSLERRIDALDAELEPLKTFVLPGGTEGAARLHIARTATRKAERAVVALSQLEPLSSGIVPWLNRLSDLLFVASRFVNAKAGVAEVPWKGA